jgi:ribosomal protein L16 Arg81 hydroxylase
VASPAPLPAPPPRAKDTTPAAGDALARVPPERRTSFGPEPFRIANALAAHPLFEPERIKRLLRALPRERVEIRAVAVSEDQSGAYRRGPMLTDVDPVAAFEDLEEKPTWMLLHDTWKHDADYARLLSDYLRDLADVFPDLARGGAYDIGCWMFLSSGRSVVHFHADPDQSFLNQIRGSKTVYVYPSAVLPETTVERLLWTYDQGAVVYDPAYEPRRFDPVHLTPGDSVFLPLYAPHRVVNDDGVCVSWNVGFNTRKSRRRRDVHLVNVELRRMGIRPSTPGLHPVRDAVKRGLRPALRAKNRVLPFLRPTFKP